MTPGYNLFILIATDVRDGCCAYCGRRMVKEFGHPYDATTDHIIPKCNGGNNSPLNKLPVCFECNQWKAGNSLEYFLRQIQARYDANIGSSNKSMARWQHMIWQVGCVIALIDRYKPEIKIRETRKLTYHGNKYRMDTWPDYSDRSTNAG